MNAYTSVVAAGMETTGLLRSADGFVQFGLVRLWDRDLAIPAEHVREVVPRPERLQPAFANGAAFVGSVIVRGQVVPVVDVSPTLGFIHEQAEAKPSVVLVLRHRDELIGLLVHSVLGLHRASAADIQPFLFAPSCEAHVITASFAFDDRLIGVIDMAAIAELPGVPRVREVVRKDRDGALIGQQKVLLLTAAGAELALDASLIVATVPATHVQPAPTVSTDWVGVIDYLGQEIPVIDDTALIGLSGRVGDGKGTLVLILKLGEGRLLGLKAEQVRRIMAVHEQDIQPLPSDIADRLPFFAGSFGDTSGAQSLLLRSDALIDDANLQAIASLTRRTRDDVSSKQGGKQEKGTTQRRTEPFLVFRIGQQRRACRLADITQIIPLPQERNRLHCPGSPLRGLASHAGSPLTLVDLGTPEDLTMNEDGRMVLIVKKGAVATGYIVDGLETIAKTQVQEVPAIMCKPDDCGSSFIQVTIGHTDEAVRVLPLAEGVVRLLQQK